MTQFSHIFWWSSPQHELYKVWYPKDFKKISGHTLLLSLKKKDMCTSITCPIVWFPLGWSLTVPLALSRLSRRGNPWRIHGRRPMRSRRAARRSSCSNSRAPASSCTNSAISTTDASSACESSRTAANQTSGANLDTSQAPV